MRQATKWVSPYTFDRSTWPDKSGMREIHRLLFLDPDRRTTALPDYRTFNSLQRLSRHWNDLTLSFLPQSNNHHEKPKPL